MRLITGKQIASKSAKHCSFPVLLAIFAATILTSNRKACADPPFGQPAYYGFIINGEAICLEWDDDDGEWETVAAPPDGNAFIEIDGAGDDDWFQMFGATSAGGATWFDTTMDELPYGAFYWEYISGGGTHILSYAAPDSSGSCPTMASIPIGSSITDANPQPGVGPGNTCTSSCSCSKHPIKYFNGEIMLMVDDLPSPTGDVFGLTRGYNNQRCGSTSSPTDYNGPVGYNWFTSQMPNIAKDSSGDFEVQLTPNDGFWFASSYSPMTPNFLGLLGLNASSMLSSRAGADDARLALYMAHVNHMLQSQGQGSGHSGGMAMGKANKLKGGGSVQLAADTTNHLLVFTMNENGNLTTMKFQDYTQTTKPQGALYSYTDPNGVVTMATAYANGTISELQRIYTVGGNTTTYSLLLNAYSSGASTFRLSGVTLRSKYNTGSWSTIRSVAYTYYDGSTSFGSQNDLKYAVIQDGSGNTIDTYYYRYWTSAWSSTSPSFIHGLKYVVNPQSYTRLLAANSASNPDSLTDLQVATYADNYFEYDSKRQVTKEVAQGAGCSCSGSSGQGTFSYSRSTSSNSNHYYNWKTKTTELLPDGTSTTIYSNYLGQDILVVNTDLSGNNFGHFYLYDADGNCVMMAESSALSLPSSLTTLDGNADVLGNSSGDYSLYHTNYGYFKTTNPGLVHIYDYSIGSISSTATTTTPGAVLDYVNDERVCQGQPSTSSSLPDLYVSTYLYIAHKADESTAGDGNGGTVYMLASETDYHNTNTTGGQTTSYAYTWWNTSSTSGDNGKGLYSPGNLTMTSGSGYLATNTIQSVTVTEPLISTGQNGPGGSAYDVITQTQDEYGYPRWTKDGDGFITDMEYDVPTHSITKQISDVNTGSGYSGDYTNLPSGWSTPSGGGLELITSYGIDGLGRTTKVTDANGNIAYTVYLDSAHQVRTYPGWQSGSSTTTGPVIVSRQDRSSATTYNENLTMAPSSISTSSGVPTGGESISNIQTLSRDYLDNSGRVVNSDVYFNFTSLTYSNSTSLGTQNTNFYRTQTGYDTEGRKYRTVDALGTIADLAFDGMDRVTSVSVGTNDTAGGGYNMTQIIGNVYDGGGVGDSRLTQATTYVDTTSADNRVTQYWYDWRDRLVATKNGVSSSETDGVHRPISFIYLDNLGRPTTRQSYDGDGTAPTVSSGVVSPPSSSLLRAETVYSYDDQNRVYQTQTFSVDQSTGSLSTYALTSIVYRNHRGETIETSSPGGLVNKSVYDGAGRLVTSYSTDGGTGSGWSNASTVTGDNVVEETINSYDSDDNLILTTTKRHDHDDTNTGELGNSSTTPKARVTYSVAYYDAINRVTATATVGTNGGSSYTRPSSVASRSDTNLVTSFTYNASTGWNDTSTDPKGIITAKYYDMMGRVVRQIEAYDGVTVPTISSLPTATSSTDRATVMTYDGLGHTLTLQAVMPSGTNSQTTQYNYGVTTSGSSFINTNNLLSYVQFPIASTGSPGTTSADKRTYTYNAVGQPLTYLDQNGTTHTYTYDVLGRKTADAVAVASGNPQGIDTSVLLQTIKFDTGHRPYQITQYNAVTSGTVVNQIEDLYNGLGQLADEYQAHGGTVNTSTSPVVVYGWSLMPSGANHSRLTSMQYPNGRSLDYVYNSGLDTTVSRISGLADDSSGSPATPHLEDYSYLGASAMVQRAHGQPGVALDLFGGTSGTYAGLDNFGRVIDQKWTGPSSTITDEFQYGYDRDSDPLYKNNTQITSLSELYHANSSTSGDNATAYDNLDRVNGFRRGTLSASGNNGSGVLDTVSTTSSLSNHSEAWSLDALGNWSSQTVDGGSAVSRTNNSKNEVTAVGSNSLTFDNNGNTTTDQTGQTYTYDAWNRLITVKSGTTTLATYAYDAHGWRVQETHSSTTTDCYFNHSWQLIEERQGSTVTNQYVWSLGYKDCLVLRDDNSTSGSLGISGSGLGRRLYAQQDCNWNTTALVNTSGAVQERFIYDPYGNVGVLNSSGSSTTDSYNWIYLHQGLRLDTATGLYNSRLRDYAPALGRWMEQDPGGYIDGANLYGYCDSSPLASTDPFGLAPNITDIRNNYAALLALEQQLEKAYNDPNNKLCPCDRDQLLATILAVQDLRAQAESAMAGADGALGQMRQAIKDYTNSNPAVAAALSAARGSLNQISDGAPNALANEPFLNAARDGLNDVNDMHGDLKNFSNALGALHDINVITGTNDPLQILGAVADLASEASGYANLPLGINTVVSQYISALSAAANIVGAIQDSQEAATKNADTWSGGHSTQGNSSLDAMIGGAGWGDTYLKNHSPDAYKAIHNKMREDGCK